MRARVALLLLCITKPAIAQLPDLLPAFEQINTPGTIRSAEILDVVQDEEGLIWIGANGLFSYNGHSFNHYTALSDSRSINHQEITCLLYDRQRSRLLIGTRNLGIVAYNYHTNSLEQLPTRGGVPIINQLAITSDGTVWAASFNSGLFHLQHDTLQRSSVAGYKSIRTSCLVPYQNKLLIGDQRKIFVAENNRVTDSVELRWNNVDFTAHGRVTALHANAGNNLYIGTEKLGMLVYNLNSREFTRYFSTSTPPFFNRINQIFTDRQGIVWILTKAGGIVLYDPAANKTLHITKDPLKPNSLSSDNCNAIMEDKNGILWIAATGSLNKYDRMKVQFQHITYDPNNSNSLSDRMVRCVFEDEDGTLLIGTDGGYINFLNRKTGLIQRVKIIIPGLSKNLMPVWFQPLTKQHLLIGTSAGMVVMDRKSKAFTRLRHPDKNLDHVLVRQILKVENSLLYIAGGSFRIYDLATRQEKVFKDFNDPARNNPIFGATAIYMDSFKRIWIGTQGGISLFNNTDSTFTYFPVKQELARPDDSYFMVLAFAEFDNHLWISTFNNGVWKLALSNENQNVQVTQRVNIPELNNYTVYCTLRDKQGLIWMGTNQGLIQYNPVTTTVRTFLPEEGVQALEFNRLAFLETRNHEFVLGGINGINIFNPDDIKLRSDLPKPVLLSLSNYKNVSTSFYINLRHRQSVTLPENQKSVSFQYLVPDYSTQHSYSVEYQLEGHDPTWINSVTAEASYPALKPGAYTFRVRTRDNDRTAEANLLQLVIRPPFWRQPWFLTTAVVLVAGLTLSAFRIQAMTSKRNKERLETLLKERTAEIEKSRAELKALNEKKDLIFSILSHDLRSPLTTLKGFLSLLTDGSSVLTPEQINQYAKSIGNSVSSALDLLDNTLYWSLSQTGSINSSPVPISVNGILVKIYNLYQLTAARKRIDFQLEAAENITAYADENMVYVALRNVASNAIKFTPEGKCVKLSAYRENDRAVICISDEGIGMSPEYVKQVLNQEIVVLKKGTANEKGTGLGLVLCRKFIELNGGSMEIISEENRGTEFRVYLPLSNGIAS
jgi:signal transduction histidine kinase/ligand-binding sensor domain-containing protein